MAEEEMRWVMHMLSDSMPPSGYHIEKWWEGLEPFHVPRGVYVLAAFMATIILLVVGLSLLAAFGG